MEPAGPTQAVFSSSEVAAHNRADDCWLVISGAVYDVTRFLREHPGGVMLLLAYAGADATMPFVETGHSRLALQQLETLRIGVLADGPADQACTGGPRLRTVTGSVVGLGAVVATACASCGAALPENGDVCGLCGQPSSGRSRAAPRLRLAGRTLQTGEEADGLVSSERPEQQQQQAAAWQSSGGGEWQAKCPGCAPACGVGRDPAQALRKGEVAARCGEWSQALAFYHEALRALDGSSAVEVVGAVRAAASVAQRRLGSFRSALRRSGWNKGPPTPPKDGAASTSLDRPEGPGRAYAPQSTEPAAWRLAAASAARLGVRPGWPALLLTCSPLQTSSMTPAGATPS